LAALFWAANNPARAHAIGYFVAGNQRAALVFRGSAQPVTDLCKHISNTETSPDAALQLVLAGR